MNLFVLHSNPIVAAQMACDVHVVKMPTETAQMLSTVARLKGLAIGYKVTHAGHPCTKWVGASKANFDWTIQHGLALCTEYTLRYLNVHRAKSVIQAVRDCAFLLHFEEERRTPFAQAMPEAYQARNAVKAYRTFYVNDKKEFAKWGHFRKAPAWWVKETA